MMDAFPLKEGKTEVNTMINREDMLALTRRMTVKRTSVTRVAGAYMDSDGYMDGTFNTAFLSLSPGEKENMLAIAKTIPFSDTNSQLKQYVFAEEAKRPGGIRQLLEAIKSCGLKNDALLETFYEVIGERCSMDRAYAVYVFHDRYDIPAKAADHERLGESEFMFEYMICSICPLIGEYEPGEPEAGFLYPAFVDGGAVVDCIDIFQKSGKSFPELLSVLGVRKGK